MDNVRLMLIAVKGASMKMESLLIGDLKRFDYNAMSNIMRSGKGIAIKLNSDSTKIYRTSPVRAFGFFIECGSEFFLVTTSNSQYIYKVY